MDFGTRQRLGKLGKGPVIAAAISELDKPGSKSGVGPAIHRPRDDCEEEASVPRQTKIKAT